LGLFTKCSIFSKLPIIEELALGLRPNSPLHQQSRFFKLFHPHTNADLEQATLKLSVIGPKPNLHHFQITHQGQLLLSVSKSFSQRSQFFTFAFRTNLMQ